MSLELSQKPLYYFSPHRYFFKTYKIKGDEIVSALQKNNVPVEYVVFPDEGHGFMKKENKINGYKAVLAFLDQHLR